MFLTNEGAVGRHGRIEELLVKLPWWAQGAPCVIRRSPALAKTPCWQRKYFPVVASRHAQESPPGCSSSCDSLLTELVSPPDLPPSPQGLDGPAHLEIQSSPFHLPFFSDPRFLVSSDCSLGVRACVCVCVCVLSVSRRVFPGRNQRNEE